MKIISTREIRNETKTYFELAEKERVTVKRGKKYVNLIVTDSPDTTFVSEEWIQEFFAIPEQYRCNPFEISPSGDLFWADKRNVAKVRESIGQAGEDNTTVRIKTRQELSDYLNSL